MKHKLTVSVVDALFLFLLDVIQPYGGPLSVSRGGLAVSSEVGSLRYHGLVVGLLGHCCFWGLLQLSWVLRQL